MTAHLLKLCVGIKTVDQLVRSQAARQARGDALQHFTRNFPRRADEILDGGSLYWVIDGFVRVRQRIVSLVRDTDAEGRSFCIIGFDPLLVRTELQPRRPHQGWRYLSVSDAPPDAADQAGDGPADGQPSPALLAELKELGLI